MVCAVVEGNALFPWITSTGPSGVMATSVTAIAVVAVVAAAATVFVESEDKFSGKIPAA